MLIRREILPCWANSRNPTNNIWRKVATTWNLSLNVSCSRPNRTSPNVNGARHDEQRNSLSNSSGVQRGNFLELIHLRCKDIAWLSIAGIRSTRSGHLPWYKTNWYIITLDQTLAEQNKFHFALVSGWIERRKKYSLVSTPRNQWKAKYCMNWWNLLSLHEQNLDLKNIFGKTLDRVANINAVHKGLSTRMAECPAARYLRLLYCLCRYVFNLALQDTMTQTEPLGNALGTIQVLCNVLEASPKQHAMFNDTDQEQGEDLKLTLKSLSAPRWSWKPERPYTGKWNAL